MEKFLRPFLGLAQVIFALFLIFFAFRMISYHFALVTFPFANTLREGAMMTSTDALVHGLNPYAMNLQPTYANVYGIVYPLLVWPLAKIFGTTILIHRIVTALSILAICALVFLVLKRMAVPILLNIWAGLMLYSSLIYPGTSTPTIDPAATGMFFFLLTIFIPWFCKYSYSSLLISVLCGILAFYTKLYTFLGVLVMLSFLFLFVSKKKSILYGFAFLILWLMSMVLVDQILPAFLDSCFFNAFNVSPAWLTMERLYLQINMYSHLHQWTLILMGVFILGYGFKFFRYNSLQSIQKKITETFLSFRINKIEEPLIKLGFPLVLYAGACSSFVLYMSLGRHNGAMLWYFFQLLSPFLLIGAAWLFSRNVFWPILCVPFLILNLYTMTADQNCKWFDKNVVGWADISRLVNSHEHILNSPLIAPLLIEQGKEIVDDGHAEYFLTGAMRPAWMKSFFKEDDRVVVQQMLFFQNIRDKLEHKEFDLVMLQPTLLPLGVADDVRKYYKYEGQIIVYAPQDRRPYEITVWRPI